MPTSLPPDLQQAIAALSDNPQGTMPSTSTAPPVWMGDWYHDRYKLPNNFQRQTPDHARYTFDAQANPTPVAADQAYLSMEGWTDAQVQAFLKIAQDAGLSISTYGDLQDAWQKAITAAQQSYAAFQAGIIDKPLTPEEALRKWGDQNRALSGGDGSGGSTYTATDVMSPSDKRAMAESAYQSEVGRNPTAGETAGLQGSSTATRTTDAQGNTTTTAGPNLGRLAVEQARSSKDYAEYQASTKYFNAMMSALGAVV